MHDCKVPAYENSDLPYRLCVSCQVQSWLSQSAINEGVSQDTTEQEANRISQLTDRARV